MSPLHTTHQIYIKGEILGDHVFDTLECCCLMSIIMSDSLFQTALEEMGKEKDAFRASNSQLTYSTNDLKSSISVVKEILTSYSWRAEVSEN